MDFCNLSLPHGRPLSTPHGIFVARASRNDGRGVAAGKAIRARLELCSKTRTEDETPFGDALLEGLREAVAWKRGEVALPVRNAPSLTADMVKAIQNFVAKTSREFSRRFGIPVRTLEGWEQGRRQPDPAASALLRLIERNPKVVEEVVEEG